MSTASNAAGERSRVGQKSAPGFMFCFIWRLMQAEAVVGAGGLGDARGGSVEGIVEGARSSADGTGSLLNRLHVPGRTKARRADWCLRVPWRCPPACSRWHRAHACPRARAGHATCSQPGLASRQGETAGPPCVGRLGTSPAASVSAWPSRTRGSLSVRWLQVPLPGAQRARR